MKSLTAVLASLLLGATLVAGAQSPPPASDDVHRYLGFLEEGADSVGASVREAEKAALVMLGSPASGPC